jgi:hypothetical protein
MNRTTEYLPNANGEFLVDENAGFYYAQPQGNAHVFVEKYAVKKIDFSPGSIGGTASSRDGYLVKETNFSDIGGGLMTFERHYAVLPTAWDGYEIVSYIEQERYEGFGGAEGQIVVNPEARPYGMFNFISNSNTVTRLAKATRTYYREDGFNESIMDLEPVGYVDPSGEIKVRPDSFRVYMAGMFEVTSYYVTY